MRILFFLLAIYCLPIFAQKTNPQQQVITRYDSILRAMPREKIYAHFDKSTYLPSDTIWFKAYLLNASLHTVSDISSLIYTEIINENGEVLQRLSLPTVLGLSWGSFAMNSEKYKPGNYTFRAYTNWMQNFGDTYFFKKEFKILPIASNTSAKETGKPANSTKTRQASLSAKEKTPDIDIQFLPEGGSYVVDRSQKIAFKALNSVGKGIQIIGEVKNTKQNIVGQFSSNEKGMGYFNLTPEAGEIYTATVNYKGFIKSVQLPKVKPEGTTLKVENEYSSDSITVTVYASNNEQNYTIIGQARGIVCFIAASNTNKVNHRKFKVAKSIFPSGVCQIILMNDEKKIVNERNFFVNHHDDLKLNLSTPSISYRLRDSIPISLNATDITGKPIVSSFSIAVTDDHQIAKDSVNDSHILSYFLLQADLKGEIENPGSYFNQVTKQKHDDLEALMLTQGWVSYDWDLAKNPSFKAEKEYTFSGTVKNVLNKPIPKAKIILMGNSKGFMMLDTLANEKGEFMFNKLPVMDSASFVIQALNANGKKGTIGIEMNEFKPPVAPIIQRILSYEPEQLDSISTNLIKTKVEEYKLTKRDGLLLNEVNIIGKRTVKGSKNINGPGGADYIISEEELNQIAKKTLYDVLLEKVKGFREGYPKKSNNRIFFVNFTVLKLVIDGIEVDFFYDADAGGPESYYHYIRSYLDYYNAEDILGIEVMTKPTYSWPYKSKFMRPMDSNEYTFLEITTKTGQGPFLKKSANMYLLKPVNYGDYKTFYHPKYTSANKNDKKPDFRSTIYWNPNLLTNAKGESNFSFFAADKPGTYTVWVEGSDMQGNFGFKTFKLIIK